MRNLGLDLLRFVAVLLVLGRHLQMPSEPGIALQLWQRGGWIGVDLFFVLSGFLVSSLLFRERIRHGSINVKRFLIRRGFKIYPAFWCFLAVSLVVEYCNGNLPGIRPLLGELLFLQNYLGGIWNHTWSLAVEEHFYIGIAALFAYVSTTRPKHRFEFVPTIFVVLATVCLALRIRNLFFHETFSHQTYLFPTHIRIDSLFFGVLIAYFCAFRDLQQRIATTPTWLLLGAGFLLLSPAFIYELESNKWISIVGVIFFYIGSGCLLLAAIRLPKSDSVILKMSGALGAASYSIYLWHMPMDRWGYPILQQFTGNEQFPIYFCFYIIGSCAFGWFMNRLIENPILFIRDKCFPSNSQTTPMQGAVLVPQNSLQQPSTMSAPASGS